MTGEDAKISGGTGGYAGDQSTAGSGEPPPSSGTGAAGGQQGDETDPLGVAGGTPGEASGGAEGGYGGEGSGEGKTAGEPDEDVPATGGF